MAFAQLEVIAGALEAATSEMCASLVRAAYSPNVKERADCSTAICNSSGQTLSLTSNAPAHLGSTLMLVGAILERFPMREISPGDVFLANDPYIVGVTHLNDCSVVAPVFIGDEPVAFSVAIAHHSDVGGRVPGSEAGDSTSIFQEGIRFPPVKLIDGGKRRRDVWELFLLNSRTPHFSDGDLHAQVAAVERGKIRVREIFDKYGPEVAASSIDRMIDATERRIRAGIAETLEDGVYRATDWLDEDGISDNPVKLAAEITIDGDDIHFDFSECADELGSGKNVPLTHTLATVYFCLKTMVDPGLPTNEGLIRSVKVTARKGSVVHPRPPAAVSSRNLTSMILADVIIDALGQAAPNRAMAAGGPFHGIILGGRDERRGRYFVNYENFAGGQGAMATADGNDAVQLFMTNTSNLPIEVTEMEFPLRVERYEMIPDSGGDGQFRGGLAVRRDIRILVDGVQLAGRSARQKFKAKGMNGGEPGSLGAYIVNPGTGEERRLPSTFSELPLNKGDLLRIETPGGGGYGDPAARDPSAARFDQREGKMTGPRPRAARASRRQ